MVHDNEKIKAADIKNKITKIKVKNKTKVVLIYNLIFVLEWDDSVEVWWYITVHKYCECNLKM